MTQFEHKFCDIFCIGTRKIGLGLGRLTLGHFGGHRCTVHQPPKQAIIKKFRLFILLFRQEGFYSLVQSSGWRGMDSKMLGTMKPEGGSFPFPTIIGCVILCSLSSPDSTTQKRTSISTCLAALLFAKQVHAKMRLRAPELFISFKGKCISKGNTFQIQYILDYQIEYGLFIRLTLIIANNDYYFYCSSMPINIKMCVPALHHFMKDA